MLAETEEFASRNDTDDAGGLSVRLPQSKLGGTWVASQAIIRRRHDCHEYERPAKPANFSEQAIQNDFGCSLKARSSVACFTQMVCKSSSSHGVSCLPRPERGFE